MATGPRLELRTTTALVMTPQLRQAIKLLQLSNLDLGQFVAEELEKNPLLERDEGRPLDGDRPAEDERVAPLQTEADAATPFESGTLPAPDDAPLDAEFADGDELSLSASGTNGDGLAYQAPRRDGSFEPDER
ncbi:MAG: RNA polymerase factor sigma-54, partial [Acetobacteraceae bacterium]